MALTKLFVVQSRKDEVLDEEVEWMANVGRPQKCPSCSRPRLGLYPTPLTAEVMHRQRATECLSGRSTINIYKRELFDRIRPHIDWVRPGPVTRPGGWAQEDSVTVHFDPRHEVTLRGGRGTKYHVCPSCGGRSSLGYSLQTPRYVLSTELPDQTGIYHIMMGTLLLSQEWIDVLSLTEFSDLCFRPVLVLDEPIEPIPELGDTVSL